MAVAFGLAPAVASAQAPAGEPTALPAAATSAAVPETAVKAQGWWGRSNLVDYGIIAAALGTVAGLRQFDVPAGAGIGPSFDPAAPAAILSPAFSDRIGRKHVYEGRGETVPAGHVGLAIPLVGLWLVLQEGLPGWLGADGSTRKASETAHLVHDTAIGFVETLAFTLAATEVLKFSFGRLRPDFQDRVRRHYCNGGDAKGVDCTGPYGPPLDPDPARAQAILTDGRRSFPSGHASTSFAIATYASLVTGGHLVWGDRATDGSRGVGILLQTASLASAVFVATSRVDDGRHHLSDVMTGAAIGFGLANLSYWRRFDAKGLPRGRHREPGIAAALDALEVSPGPVPIGASVGLRF